MAPRAGHAEGGACQVTTYVSNREASHRLGVHPNTLRNWADEGYLRVERLPTGFRRIPASEVERLEKQMDLGLPYRPRTRQEDGTVTEKRVLKERGARQHPRSGAGSIKEDGSTAEHLIEVKDANIAFGLKSQDLMQSYKRAVAEDKDAIWVIRFANGIEAEIHLGRYK